MTANDDHGPLPEHAERLLVILETIGTHSVHGKVGHHQHTEFERRVAQLAQHLRAAQLLSDHRLYPSALVVIRAALEHHLMDRLILLANRYVVVHTNAKEKDKAKWDAELEAAQAADASDIDTWFWDREHHLNVVRRGLHSDKSKKGRGQVVSNYYFEIDHYDPFLGPKWHSHRLAAPFWEKSVITQLADEQRSRWKYLFRWSAVMKALRVNNLLVGRHMQVDVHYAFLSGFTHPSKRGYEAIFGGNWPDRMGMFDHYASELVLLYIIAIAAAEIETWGRMARRSPRLELRDWDKVMGEVVAAQQSTSYFWFLSGAPEAYDQIETVHTPVGDKPPKWGRPRRDPARIRPARVHYYRNPLQRLIELHQSRSEMSTGLVYRSPFERSDARLR